MDLSLKIITKITKRQVVFSSCVGYNNFMNKENVTSFEEILVFIRNNKSTFYKLIEICRKLHSLIFDYNTVRALDDDDKDKLAKLENEIDSEQKKVLEIIKTAFDCGNLELNPKTIFNEIVLPLSEVEDK